MAQNNGFWDKKTKAFLLMFITTLALSISANLHLISPTQENYLQSVVAMQIADWMNYGNITSALETPVGSSYSPLGRGFNLITTIEGVICWARGNDSKLMAYSTNTSAVFQNAADNGADKEIFVPAGTYNITNTIVLTKTVHIVGEGNGMASTVLRLADNANCDMFRIEGGLCLPYFAHMKLEGNKGNQAVVTCAINQTNSIVSADITLYDIWFRGWKGNAVKLTCGWDHHISRCQFELSDDYGIYLYQSQKTNEFPHAMITGCQFAGNGGGIKCDYASGDYPHQCTIIEGNIFNEELGNACINPRGAQGMIISNNIFSYCLNPILFDGFKGYVNIQIFGNYFQFEDVAIKNNSTYHTNGIQIESNTFRSYHAAALGMILVGPSVGTKISNNYFDATGQAVTYGIDSSNANANDTEIKDNTFVGTYTNVLTFGSQHPLVQQNVGFTTENSGSIGSCINGTWIPHGLDGTPTSIHVWVDGSSYLNSTSSLLQPTVISKNSTHFQIGFYEVDTRVNRLSGVVGTATGWGVAPDLTLATDNDFSTVGAEGNTTVSGAAQIGTVQWDMGATYDVTLLAKVGLYSSTSSVTGLWWYSVDGSNYYQVSNSAAMGITSTTEVDLFDNLVFCQARYVRLRFTSGATEVGHVLVHEVQALDLNNVINAVSGSGYPIMWQTEYRP
jgi:hypothetical protein